MRRLEEYPPSEWARIVANLSEYPFPGDPLLVHETTVQADLEEVLSFFLKPKNVVALTPEKFQMRLVRGNGEDDVTSGQTVTYASRIFGVNLPWHAYFPYVWQSPESGGFIDLQVRGLFRRWCHVHRLERIESGGTRIVDWTRWRLPLPSMIHIIPDKVVDRTLRELFKFREQKLIALFGSKPETKPPLSVDQRSSGGKEGAVIDPSLQ